MQIRVVPKEGILIRDPFLKTMIPPDGEVVNDSLFWRRRAIDGDVVLTELSKAEVDKRMEVPAPVPAAKAAPVPAAPVVPAPAKQ